MQLYLSFLIVNPDLQSTISSVSSRHHCKVVLFAFITFRHIYQYSACLIVILNSSMPLYEPLPLGKCDAKFLWKMIKQLIWAAIWDKLQAPNHPLFYGVYLRFYYLNSETHVGTISWPHNIDCNCSDARVPSRRNKNTNCSKHRQFLFIPMLRGRKPYYEPVFWALILTTLKMLLVAVTCIPDQDEYINRIHPRH